MKNLQIPHIVGAIMHTWISLKVHATPPHNGLPKRNTCRCLSISCEKHPCHTQISGYGCPKAPSHTQCLWWCPESHSNSEPSACCTCQEYKPVRKVCRFYSLCQPMPLSVLSSPFSISAALRTNAALCSSAHLRTRIASPVRSNFFTSHT